MNTPFAPQSFVQETLQQTTANWAGSGDLVLLTYQWGQETDGIQRCKRGDGVTPYRDLPYWMPSGQIYDLPSGDPSTTDQIEYNAVTPAEAAVGSFTCEDIGTVGAVIIVGDKLYVIVASGATGDQINRGASASAFGDNIAAKVTTDTVSTSCTAVNDAGVVTFTANERLDAAGNDIPLSSNDPHIDTLVPFAGGSAQVNVLKKTPVSGTGIGNPLVGYGALLTQASTDAPVPSNVTNNLPASIAFQNSDVGEYPAYSVGSFPDGTYVQLTIGSAEAIVAKWERFDNDTLHITTFEADGSTPAELHGTMSIQIFP